MIDDYIKALNLMSSSFSLAIAWHPNKHTRYGLNWLERTSSSDVAVCSKKVYVGPNRVRFLLRAKRFYDAHPSVSTCCFYVSLLSSKAPPKRHANLLVIDRTKRTCMVFDPRGPEHSTQTYPQQLDALRSNVEKIFGAEYRFVCAPDSFCPQRDVQDKNVSGKGLCSFWTLWLAHELLHCNFGDVYRPCIDVYRLRSFHSAVVNGMMH